MPWVQRNQNGNICAVYALKQDDCAEEFLDDTNDEVVEFLTPLKPEPRLVRKSLIIDRLQDAGKLEAAYAALQAAPLYDRQRWEVRDSVYYNDPTMLAALNAIGADPAVIMAAE